MGSQTIAYLQLGRTKEEKQKHKIKVQSFTFSQNHEFLAVYTSDNCLYTYKVAELIFKDSNGDKNEDHFNDLLDDPAGGNQVIVDAINSEEMNDSNIGSMKNESVNIDDDLNINLKTSKE